MRVGLLRHRNRYCYVIECYVNITIIGSIRRIICSLFELSKLMHLKSSVTHLCVQGSLHAVTLCCTACFFNMYLDAKMCQKRNKCGCNYQASDAEFRVHNRSVV